MSPRSPPRTTGSGFSTRRSETETWPAANFPRRSQSPEEDFVAGKSRHLRYHEAMPEGPEVPTETLTEEIREEFEHEGGPLLKRIALSTALFAALAAIAALKAGATVNEARPEDRGGAAPGGGVRPVGLLPGQGDQGGDRGGVAHLVARHRQGTSARVRRETEALRGRAERNREEGAREGEGARREVER